MRTNMMSEKQRTRTITGYPGNFCSGSNDCDDKSGFDHYNQWPTSKVIMIMIIIMMVIMMKVTMIMKSKAKSGLGGVAGAKVGNETRPINVRVVWIIKCWSVSAFIQQPGSIF